jgi:hypothetical protein
MTTQDLLKLMRVLSAMESIMFATKVVIPDYLIEDANAAVERLEKEILSRTKENT